MLTVIDEWTRACLAIIATSRLASGDVLQAPSSCSLTTHRRITSAPTKGPEFVAKVVRGWLGVTTLFIAPGSPWENAHSGSFSGKLRAEPLDREVFYSLREAEVPIERRRRHCNTIRPRSALGYRPPVPEAVLP